MKRIKPLEKATTSPRKREISIASPEFHADIQLSVASYKFDSFSLLNK